MVGKLPSFGGGNYWAKELPKIAEADQSFPVTSKIEFPDFDDDHDYAQFTSEVSPASTGL